MAMTDAYRDPSIAGRSIGMQVGQPTPQPPMDKGPLARSIDMAEELGADIGRAVNRLQAVVELLDGPRPEADGSGDGKPIGGGRLGDLSMRIDRGRDLARRLHVLLDRIDALLV